MTSSATVFEWMPVRVGAYRDASTFIEWRIQRELLDDPDDDGLRDLLDELLAMPTVDPAWRQVDLAMPSEPALVLHLRVGDVEDLSFDGALQAMRTADGLVIKVGGHRPDLIALQAGTRVDLPLGEATALWSGRTLEVRGCPPPVHRAPAVNLLVRAARR